MSKIYKILFIFILSVGFTSAANGQGAAEVFRFSLQYPSYDPVTLVMPGAAHATGFGAYQENPAVMALFNESFFSGGLSDRYVSEEGTYLGNTSAFDVNSLGLSHAGFVYKVPTTQGSLVIGGGYSQTTGYNRALTGFGLNEQTTVTDFYAGLPATEGGINEAAFNAFAIDDVFDENGDRIGSLSIFRFLPEGESYRGINQSFELTETGSAGEYSLFIATELIENLFVGVSLGAITGNYDYERIFLESDERGVYNDAFIDPDGDGQEFTDIDHILSESFIRTTFTGFSARLGMVFELTPNIHVGGAYQFKNVLFLERETDFFITTTFDNGQTLSGESLPPAFNYKIIRPARFTFGISLTDLSGFTLSAMGERVDYTTASIEFDQVEYSDDEESINAFAASNFREVINLRFGLEYTLNDRLTPRVGFGYYPSPVEPERFPDDIDTDRYFFSGGFSAQVSENTILNVGVQYGTWEDQNVLYTTDIGTPETIEEQVNRWNIMAGLKYYF